jgi:rubrerythrin
MGTRLEDFVAFAIEQEIKAAQLYEKYAAVVDSRTARQLLKEMAAMEREHEAKLRDFLATGRMFISKIGELTDLHIGDYLVDASVNATSTVEEVFVFAMKAEQKAYDLYTKLALLEENGQLKRLFASLATEEKKHKFDLEKEYEKLFLREG